jgi:hypothetical protein
MARFFVEESTHWWQNMANLVILDLAVDEIPMLLVMPMICAMPAALKANTRSSASRALASIN